MPKRLNACLGEVDFGSLLRGRDGGGARWTRHAICPACGKDIKVTKAGRLRRHGTYKGGSNGSIAR